MPGGYRLRHTRILDWERQADIAERATNGFIMLIADRQVEDLDVDEEVVFIKLIQLVGG